MTATPAKVPAAPGSPLSSLRARREEARQRSKLDLRVPGYEPAMYVRFRPLNPDELESVRTRHAKAKPTEQPLRIASALVAIACTGIFEVDPETGDEVSIDADDRDGAWPRFDERLAELLEMPEASKASDVVQALYSQKMHILAVGDELAAWSLTGDQELRRTDQGE